MNPEIIARAIEVFCADPLTEEQIEAGLSHRDTMCRSFNSYFDSEIEPDDEVMAEIGRKLNDCMF